MSKKIISNLETIEQLIESEGIPPLDNRYDVWFDLRNSDVGGLGGSTGQLGGVATSVQNVTLSSNRLRSVRESIWHQSNSRETL